MDGFELLRTFQAVAERSSFSRTAVALRMSPAAVSKHISQLETRFGVRLLNRSTRSVSLTDAGRLLLERSKPLLETLETTAHELEAHARQPSGRLHITAPHGLEHSPLPGVLGAFMNLHPQVHVSLRLSNRVVDLVQDGVDVAIRMGRLNNDNLIVRRLHSVSMSLCATPRYWARRGLPRTPEDIRKHDVLTYSLLGPTPTLPFQTAGPNGEIYAVPVNSRMDANDAVALISAALADLGVICVPTVMVRQHLSQGALVPVLQEHLPRDLWLYAAFMQRRQNSAAMRALLEFLAERIQGDEAFDSSF
ncbi:LysR family transcriptional regulator [Variovorax sp. EL159]|uniref:LysR family transcriptional regulator n=1 Tax=Variovorax sp. EL159 TaxID=1566270 RepID=UPI00087FB3A6|nr:LysR family transcriptional regulator [Variovorax sp. EL159]SCX72589.1 DNA-binding transcriptional regulator, LysR family [Variovorax sp. EL159]